MTERQGNKPWEGGDQSFGSWLRSQREIRQISLREVADTTKISLRYLEALEQDRFEVLPASVFVRGFLREYARVVGLDPDDVVNFFLSASGDENASDEPRDRPSTAAPGSPWRSSVLLGGASILVLVLLVALSYISRRSGGEEAPPPMAPPVQVDAPDPVPTTLEEVEKAPIEVTLDFTQKSSVEAYVDGERRVNELRVQGESLRLEAQREVRLKLGNAAAVAIEVNGTPLAHSAGDDEDIVIDASTSNSSLGEPN